MSRRVCTSASAAERLAAAREAIAAHPPGTRILIVAPTRGAADDLARSVAATKPATFGIERLSLTQLAARTAVVALATEGMTPSTPLGAEAVAARAVFDARAAGTLEYFGPVAGTPGFPRALARTLDELRLAHIEASSLRPLPLGGGDLAGLLARVEAAFETAATADRARLFETAARLARGTRLTDLLVLLDLALDRAAERALIEAAMSGAGATLATVPHGEDGTRAFFVAQGALAEERSAPAQNDLAALRQNLFAADVHPPARPRDDSVQLFSAPGEGREAVEVVRRILIEARRGVPFDEMAILVRSPHSYFGLIDHALARGGVPAWFDRGTRRPHPAGRAFLALLACRAEQLSAARFAEYLSLGQVPPLADADGAAWSPSRDEALSRAPEQPPDAAGVDPPESDRGPTDEDAPVAAGTLRAPWRWEKLLVEASVIGQDASRWRRRLDGKAREIDLQIEELRRRDGADDARVGGLVQTLAQLGRLRDFALPIVERLAEWPAAASWGEWLDRFEALAPAVLRSPAHVLRVLADLRPMAGVGPVDLDEARRVLAERLLSVEAEAPARRFGRVFVGLPHHARGRSFRVVFVPGLAERMFPQKPREDPLLLDGSRSMLDGLLPVQDDRLLAERLLLQLAAGAAVERLYLSYPRLDLGESRPRVPSFYALDVVRAATGAVPDHERLEEQARDAGRATLAWPAPQRPEDAIDDQEHDLAVLRRLLDEPDPRAVRGHAHYLLELNESLRRAVRARWSRGERRWSASDGLTGKSLHTAPALAAQRMTARPYSLTALQRFSACPYQFALAAFYRLQPLERPEPLQRMDPLTRGSIFHEIQARFFRTLLSRGALPVTAASAPAARDILDAIVAEVTAAKAQELAPAVERVWADDVASVRRDLHAWLDRLARDGEEWTPAYFELAFGTVPGERDPASLAEPVTLGPGFKLRGAVDLIEVERATGALRVTDHKTGRKPEGIEGAVVSGGAVLQPVLYAVAVEAALGRPVKEGRLFYCTSAGGFFAHAIPIDERTRAAGLDVLHVIDRALASGFLPAAPTEHACDRCDFRPVCGPGVYARTRRKPREPLADLLELRSRP